MHPTWDFNITHCQNISPAIYIELTFLFPILRHEKDEILYSLK